MRATGREPDGLAATTARAGQLSLALLLGLIAAVGALLIFAWLARGTRAGHTFAFDETLRAALHQYASPGLTALMRAVTQLGSTKFLLFAGALSATTFALLRWWRALTLFSFVFLGAILLNQSLKLIFQRARPSPFFDTPLPSSYSFPSGHALWSFCCYGALAAILNARIRNRAARSLVWTLVIVLVGLIGISRVYLGVHYPSDVLAGYAIALVWVVAVALGDHLLRRHRSATAQQV